MLKFRQNISFRFVTIGDLTPKEKILDFFCLFKKFPKYQTNCSTALVSCSDCVF